VRRKRRDDFYDARITQRALDLYKLGCAMLRDGVSPSSREWCEVAFALPPARAPSAAGGSGVSQTA
jgi:hypothetical protein